MSHPKRQGHGLCEAMIFLGLMLILGLAAGLVMEIISTFKTP